MRTRTAPLLLTIMLLCLFAGIARGSASRIAALGDTGDFLEDASNVLRWYGTLPAYSNTLVAELGRREEAADTGAPRLGRGLGLFFDLGEAARLGTAGAFLSGEDGLDPAGGSISLFWGKSGQTHDLGFMIRMRDDEEALGATSLGYDFLRSEHDLTLGAGLRIDMNPRTYCDIAVDLTGTDRTLVENGWILMDQQERYATWGTRMRVFRSLGPDLALTGNWAYDHRNHGWLGGEPPLPASMEQNATRFGTGLTYFPDPDSMFLLGFEYTDLKGMLEPTYGVWASPSVEWDYRAFDVFMALEKRILPWLTLRTGVRSSLSEKENYPPPQTTGAHYWAQTGIRGDVDRTFDLYLGLALHIGDFDIDLVVNEDPLFHLGNTLTGGEGSSEANISSISITYVF